MAFFTFPIATVLFPTFSKLDPSKELGLLKTVYNSAVKYSALLLVPATFITIVLSEPMIAAIFGQKWLYSPSFLALNVIQNLLVLLGSIVMQSFLSGIGETKILLKLNIFKFCISIPLVVILISTYGLVGLIIGNLLSVIPFTIWGLYWIWKNYDIRPSLKSSAKILFASVVSALITYFSICLFEGNLIKIIMGSIIFLIAYIVLIPLVGAVNSQDVQTLKTMVSSLGHVSKLVNPFIVVIEKVAKVRENL